MGSSLFQMLVSDLCLGMSHVMTSQGLIDVSGEGQVTTGFDVLRLFGSEDPNKSVLSRFLIL